MYNIMKKKKDWIYFIDTFVTTFGSLACFINGFLFKENTKEMALWCICGYILSVLARMLLREE